MSLDPDALARITASTLAHYNARAEAFWAGTRDHDVRQNIEALLQAIGRRRPSRSSISAAAPAAT